MLIKLKSKRYLFGLLTFSLQNGYYSDTLIMKTEIDWIKKRDRIRHLDSSTWTLSSYGYADERRIFRIRNLMTENWRTQLEYE